MAHVWILSEGEKYEGERVLAVFKSYDSALAELKSLSEMSGNTDIRVDWTAASFEDGIFYTIIREMEVTA
jgi:hypothetical protein